MRWEGLKLRGEGVAQDERVMALRWLWGGLKDREKVGGIISLRVFGEDRAACSQVNDQKNKKYKKI